MIAVVREEPKVIAVNNETVVAIFDVWMSDWGRHTGEHIPVIVVRERDETAPQSNLSQKPNGTVP